MSISKNKVSDLNTHYYKQRPESGWIEHEVEQPVDKSPSTLMLESIFLISQTLFWMITTILIIMDSIESKTPHTTIRGSVWVCLLFNGIYLSLITYSMVAIKNSLINVKYLYSGFCFGYSLILLVYILMVTGLIPLPHSIVINSKFIKTTMGSSFKQSLTKWKSLSFFPFALSLSWEFEDLSGLPMGIFILAICLNQILLAMIGGVISIILQNIPKTRWTTILIPETNSYIKDKGIKNSENKLAFGSDETITNTEWTKDGKGDNIYCCTTLSLLDTNDHMAVYDDGFAENHTLKQLAPALPPNNHHQSPPRGKGTVTRIPSKERPHRM